MKEKRAARSVDPKTIEFTDTGWMSAYKPDSFAAILFAGCEDPKKPRLLYGGKAGQLAAKGIVLVRGNVSEGFGEKDPRHPTIGLHPVSAHMALCVKTCFIHIPANPQALREVARALNAEARRIAGTGKAGKPSRGRKKAA